MYKEIWHYTYEASYVLLAKYKDSILISDGDNSVQLDLESGNEITTSTSLGYTFIFHTEFSELIVVCKSYSILSSIYGVYSFITNRILFWSNDIRLVRIFGELIINKTENDIYSLDKFGEKIWHFTPQSLKKVYPEKMEKYGENKVKINHFVGVVNSILWLDVDVNNNGSFLLGLDTETGKCVYFLNTVEHQNYVPSEGEFVGLPYATFTTHDAERNILFGFAPDWFHWQVDLSSSNPTIKMWSLEDEMTKHHAFVSAYMDCGISDSHVFFPVGSLGSTPQVFALNRETLKVDWQYHFTEGGQYFTTPTKVEVTDTHLYVLDNTGTLNIFEKEENA